MRRHVHLGSRAFPTLPNSVYNISDVEKLIKELHSVSVDVSNGDTHTVEKGHKLSTMWIFVLVMMDLTRTRSDKDSRVPTIESVAEGSAYAITTRTTRRRKRGSADTRAAGLHLCLNMGCISI
ncbi:hypothetical protein L1987_80388 [Smallanthus sonchifolius]|uniref:Uncharacterized protein n=1 Tax=Smallanthus sonchifolius TaxID=185202 RepID=A0ACB8YMZ1_9ASTR|nr:hypothetical protein L1987_80388 [Smallanthus sonchifolius]